MTFAPLAVSDTNILISALLSRRGNEARIISLLRGQEVVPAVSGAVIAEYKAVLTRPKFRFDRAAIDGVLFPFFEYGLRVEPLPVLAVSPHEPDNRLLECAEAANADFLITGNLRHFPATHGNTRILNAKAFLDVMQGRG
jgi:putative PIN family toxin of toxin-antitoxin system